MSKEELKARIIKGCKCLIDSTNDCEGKTCTYYPCDSCEDEICKDILEYFDANVKPHLESQFGDYGTIGELTGIKDIFGELLKVGDIVEVYKQGVSDALIEVPVCKDNEGPFIMTLRIVSEQPSQHREYKWRKVKGCEELKNGETYPNGIKVVK